MKYILALLIGSSITVQATDYFIGADIGLGGELEGFGTDVDVVDFSIQAGIDLGGASYDNNFSSLLFFEYSSGDDSEQGIDIDYDSYTINTAFTYKYNKVVSLEVGVGAGFADFEAGGFSDTAFVAQGFVNLAFSLPVDQETYGRAQLILGAKYINTSDFSANGVSENLSGAIYSAGLRYTF